MILTMNMTVIKNEGTVCQDTGSVTRVQSSDEDEQWHDASHKMAEPHVPHTHTPGPRA